MSELRILKTKVSWKVLGLVCFIIPLAGYLFVYYVELALALFGILILSILFLTSRHMFVRKFPYVVILLNVALITFFNVIWYRPPIETGLEEVPFQFAAVSVHWTDIYIVIVALMAIYVMLINKKSKTASQALWRNGVFRVLFVYSLYQIMIVAPMAYFQSIPLDSLVRRLIPRLSLIIYFVFFYEVLKKGYFNFARWERLLRQICIALLFISIWNLLVGNIIHTSSGTIRTLWGVSSIIFGMNFISGFVRKRPNILDMLTGIVGIMMINHRSAFLSLAIVIFLSVFWSETKHSGIRAAKIFRNITALAIITLILLIFSSSFIVKQSSIRFSDSFNSKEANTLYRLRMWKLAFDTFLENPIFGVGLKSDLYQGQIKELVSPHNFVIRTLAQQGIIGTIFFVILFSIISINIIRHFDYNRRLFWIIGMSILFYTTFCLFNTYFYKVQSQLYFMLMVAMSEYYARSFSQKK